MTSTVNGIMDSNGPMPETIEKEDRLKVSCEIIKADFQSSHESLFQNCFNSGLQFNIMCARAGLQEVWMHTGLVS